MKTRSYRTQDPWDPEPAMSTAYIIGSVPFPAVSERQSVLCAPVSAWSLWLSSPNCQTLPREATSVTGHPIRSASAEQTPMARRTSIASVSHLFLLLAGLSGSLPWPSELPFHLGSHSRSGQGGLLISSHPWGLSLLPSRTLWVLSVLPWLQSLRLSPCTKALSLPQPGPALDAQ